MLSDKYLPSAVMALLGSLVSLLAPRISKMLGVKAESVVKIGVAIVAVVVILLVYADFTSLPKPQPWVTPVLLCVGVFLWMVVILRLQLRLGHISQDVRDAVSSLIGAPNVSAMHGQNVQTPFKYPTISALSNAIADAENGVKALVNWTKWRQEDDSIVPPQLTAHVSIIDDHTLEVSIAIAFSADTPITIANLTFGWLKQGLEWTGKEDGREIVRFGLFAGEREVDKPTTFTQRFELERSFGQKRLPCPHLVGLSYTTHHIVWKSWECGV